MILDYVIECALPTRNLLNLLFTEILNFLAQLTDR